MRQKTDEQKQLEAEFYAKKFQLSYSGLNKLLSSPTVFYKHYVLGEEEKLDNPSITQGNVIHTLLLDKESFNDKFVIASANIPTGNTQLVVDRIFDIHAKAQNDESMVLNSYQNEILSILIEINLHQSLKTDQQRLDKIITDQSNDYFEYLKSSNGKTIIDLETYEKCIIAVENILDNENACKLLGLKTDPENRVYNEYPLQIETLEGFPFGLKGILDNLHIDFAAKTVFINDLKRTGKSLIYFKESVEAYNYWAQAAMYRKLVEENLKSILVAGWRVVFNFIVVDAFNQVYCFEVTEETLNKWSSLLQEKLTQAAYHYSENDYSLPFEFATGSVRL